MREKKQKKFRQQGDTSPCIARKKTTEIPPTRGHVPLHCEKKTAKIHQQGDASPCIEGKKTIKQMDTGDLSDETYYAILSEAEEFNTDLTLQFGLLSEECDNEKIFIEKSIELIEIMKKFDEIDLDDMFFGNPPKIKEFHEALQKIAQNIEDVKKTKK